MAHWRTELEHCNASIAAIMRGPKPEATRVYVTFEVRCVPRLGRRRVCCSGAPHP